MPLDVDLLSLARNLLNNPFTRSILRKLAEEDLHGYRSKLDHALTLIAGESSKIGISLECIINYKLFKALLTIAFKRMKIDEDEFRMVLRDPSFRRGLEIVFRSLMIYGVTLPQRLCTPFLIVWNFTNACNLKCKHCYQNASTPLPNELSLEEKLDVLNQLDEIGVPLIALSGGEPTIHPDFLKIVEEGSKKGIFMAVATNGIRFSCEDFAEKALRAGLKYVEVSLDSVDPEIHDEIRGVKGAWERTIKGIRNLVRMNASVGIAMTVNRLNFKEVEEMVKLGEELNVKRVIFFNFIPTGRGKEIAQLDLTPHQREELLRKVYEMASKSRIQIASTAPQLARVSWQMSGGEECIPTHFTPSRNYSLRVLAEFIGGCGAGRIYAAIQPDGKVTPCVFLPLIIGDLRDSKFQDLWNHSPLLRTLRNKNLLKYPCGGCSYKYICGGCRARAYGYFNDYLAGDPGCLRGLHISLEAEQRIFDIQTTSRIS
ncbi:MAG: radical SAM protein [Aigarchaeota archaeon]|nr:radical SAM protein [Aigarchaeota archaeon]MCX8192555.1 radical SAM protein [Nitrososphaeria archaeon]MDW7985709.1 radical SAM protein [Nitrososphaerota archaeon]